MCSSQDEKARKCNCGNDATFWLLAGWVYTGCKGCEIAGSAFKSFELSVLDWNLVRTDPTKNKFQEYLERMESRGFKKQYKAIPA